MLYAGQIRKRSELCAGGSQIAVPGDGPAMRGGASRLDSVRTKTAKPSMQSGGILCQVVNTRARLRTGKGAVLRDFAELALLAAPPQLLRRAVQKFDQRLPVCGIAYALFGHA